MDEWHLLIWSSIGTMLAFLHLLAEKDIRDGTFEFFRGGHGLMAAILLEEIFDFMGRLFSIFAFALGTVALVSAVGAKQPTMTLIYILALSQFVPGILEDINRKRSCMSFIELAL